MKELEDVDRQGQAERPGLLGRGDTTSDFGNGAL